VITAPRLSYLRRDVPCGQRRHQSGCGAGEIYRPKPCPPLLMLPTCIHNAAGSTSQQLATTTAMISLICDGWRVFPQNFIPIPLEIPAQFCSVYTADSSDHRGHWPSTATTSAGLGPPGNHEQAAITKSKGSARRLGLFDRADQRPPLCDTVAKKKPTSA